MTENKTNSECRSNSVYRSSKGIDYKLLNNTLYRSGKETWGFISKFLGFIIYFTTIKKPVQA